MALEARIKQLLALDENRKCADCGTRSPRWASYSLGIFVCLQCAGFHRALGVHISRVKSCDLDRWTEDQVRAMESVGNACGRDEYGPSYAEVNNTTCLPDAGSLETFIRSKYARRLYAKGGFGASFNTPECAARKPQQGGEMWTDSNEPEIDTTSKVSPTTIERSTIRIDWPRKTAAPLGQTGATSVTPQKEPSSLIDLFEPTPVPVVQQVQQLPTTPAPLFADFAAALAAPVQQVQQQTAAAAPVDPFFADFAASPLETAGAPAADPFGLTAAVTVPKSQSQLSFANFQMQSQRQLPLDDDFGDFVIASVATKRVDMEQKTTWLIDEEKNVPPLPTKDYQDPFQKQPPLPTKDYPDLFQKVSQPPPLPTKDYASPAVCAVDTALAGLFASSLTTLAPSGAATPAAAPASSVASATTPRMSTADIMALYGGGVGGPKSPAMPAFVANFGGSGGYLA